MCTSMLCVLAQEQFIIQTENIKLDFYLTIKTNKVECLKI